MQGLGEGAVPVWMRSAEGEAKEAPPPSTLRPSSFSAPNTDERPMSRRSINANSLIDEQSLPAWMRQDGPPTAAPPQKNIPASSLIQAESVPEWMRTLQQQPAASPPAQAAQSTVPVSPLPPDFSARDLIDPQSLPPWMVQQGGSPVTPAPSKGQTFSASSLLDMNALPAWMRESDAERGTTPGATYGDVEGQGQHGAIASRAQPWQQQGFPAAPSSPHPMQTPTGSSVNQTAGPSQNNLSAASFIDRNALPEWLRAEAEQQPSPIRPLSPPSGSTGNMLQPARGAGSYAVPPRSAEHVRVPNRPRGEMGPPESSEVAANVFASMLGVASNAPQFPAQVQGMPNGQRSPQQGMHPGMPPSQYGLQGQMPGAFPPGAPQQMPQGYPAGAYNPGHSGNFQPNSVGMPPMGPGMIGDQRGNVKPVKRNLFEAIRNWLFRS